MASGLGSTAVVSRLEAPAAGDGVRFGEFTATSAEGDRIVVEFGDLASAFVEDASLAVVLVVVDPRLRVTGALPVRLERRVTVGETATLFGTDQSRAVHVVASVKQSPPELRLRLRHVAGASAVPEELLPAFRFLRQLTWPNRLGIEIDGRMIGEPHELSRHAGFSAELTEVARSLALVQRLTSVRFPLPSELGPEDLRSLGEAEGLLLGATHRGRWTEAKLGFSVIDPELLEVVGSGTRFRLEFAADVTITISGHVVELGEGRYVFDDATVGNYEELALAAASGTDPGDTTALLTPVDDDTYSVSLLAPPELGIDDNDVRPAIHASDDLLVLAESRRLHRGALRAKSS